MAPTTVAAAELSDMRGWAQASGTRLGDKLSVFEVKEAVTHSLALWLES